MHEAGIADRILEAATAEARARGARLTGVEVEAGPEAPVSEEALRFHWQHVCGHDSSRGAAAAIALRIVPVEEPGALRLVAIDGEGGDDPMEVGDDDEHDGGDPLRSAG